MNKTKIEWVKNPDGSQGYTWNPITGCRNGCSYCYARKLANGRLAEIYLANENIAPKKDMSMCNKFDPFYPRFWEERLTAFRLRFELNRNPKGIFVCDMSDLFGIGIPKEWTRKVMHVITKCPQHRFYLLTNQPPNLSKWSPFPENCWVGMTVTHGGIGDASSGSIVSFEDIEATIKFISFEPLLGQMDFQYYTDCDVDWIIIGAQTKPYLPPQIEWVEEIVRAADMAGIPVFLKDNLKPLMLSNLYNSQGWGWANHKLRQEMPI